MDRDIKSVYKTNDSDSHTTLSSFKMLGLRLGGTSWAISVPYSSTISIVTTSGRGKDESQNTAATRSLQTHFPRPMLSSSMEPENTRTESSSSTTPETVSASNTSTRTTPGFESSLEISSSQRIWMYIPSIIKNHCCTILRTQ